VAAAGANPGHLAAGGLSDRFQPAPGFRPRAQPDEVDITPPRVGHRVQVALHADTLNEYGYVGDTSPAETAYVGVHQSGGTWYAINAAGKVVK